MHINQLGSKNISYVFRRCPKGHKNELEVASEEVDSEEVDMDHLICSITGAMFKDPMLVVDSGQTYECRAIQEHFRKNGFSDPMTRIPCSSNPKLVPNFLARRGVQAWLEQNPETIPDGWSNRRVGKPSKPISYRWDRHDDGSNWKRHVGFVLLLVIVRFAK